MKLLVLFSPLLVILFAHETEKTTLLNIANRNKETDSIYVEKTHIGCLAITRFDSWFMVKNEEEYERLLDYNTYYGDCSTYEFPAIDFSNYDLLCIKLKYGGCGSPNITINATEDRVNRRVKLDATLKNGFCRKLNVGGWFYFLVTKPSYNANYELFLNNRRR